MISTRRYCGEFKPANGVIYDRAKFHFRRLFRDACSIFELTGDVPKTVNIDYLYTALITDGFALSVEKNNDLYILRGSYSGNDAYTYPTDGTVVSPTFKNIQGKLGENIFVFPSNRFWEPAIYIINHYADTLARIDIAKTVNLSNLILSRIFCVDNEQEKQQLALMVDEVSRGNPAVFTKKSLLSETTNLLLNADTPFLVDKLDISKTPTIHDFLGEFGVECLPTEKSREIFSSEISVGMRDIAIKRANWLDVRNEYLEKFNKHYGLNLSWKIKEPDLTLIPTMQNNAETETENAGGENNVKNDMENAE